MAARAIWIAPKSLTPEKVLHTEVLNKGEKAARKGRRKKIKEMSDTQTAQVTETPAQAGEVVTRTVFDLDTFKSATLAKYVQLPAKPGSIQDALAMVDNDSNRLLDMVYKGLSEEIKDKAREDISGFYTRDDTTGKPDLEAPYHGNYANEEKMALINAAVLSFAKLSGKWDTADTDGKRDLKEEAREFIRSNPGMIKSLKS